MNEIISALERANEKARSEYVPVRPSDIRSEALEYRAVYHTACDYLADTIHLFRHARKLKQKLEADSRKGPGLSTPFTASGPHVGGRFNPPPREEQDAPD